MPQDSNIDQILEGGGERYLPLFQYVLKRSNPEFAFPDNGRIRKLRQMIAARNAFLFEELKKLLQAFDEAGIEVILLKGVMMEGIYPPGLRPFTDMDLLIRRRRLPQVIEIIFALGYRPYAPQLRPGAEDFQGAVNYVKEGEIPIMIEPHWTLGPPYPYPGRLDMEGLRERVRKADVAGVDALILSPEDCLLHSCLHLFQHYRNAWLTSSCDIAELVYHYEDKLDWEDFLSRIFEYKLCLPVQYSLEKTFDLFKYAIPPFVLERLGRYKPGGVERQVFALLTRPGSEDSGSGVLARFLTMPVALKFRYLWLRLFPQREFMLWHYNITRTKLLPFYYLLRLKDAFLTALKTLYFYFSEKR